jgi:ABC-type multidrug transport system fused ATPase/permease subunit
LFLAVRRYRSALVERMRVVRAKEGAIASVIQEAVTGIRAVKIFGREDDELERFRTESEESLRASVDSSLIEAKFSILLGLVGGFGTALVLYFAALQVLSGALSVGQLTVFIAYLGLFLSPLWALSRQANQIGKSLVSGERIVELLGAEPSVKESPDARPARLYDPQRGRVLVDDQDIRGFTLKSLRDSITFVPQEPMLFRASVAENIGYGKSGATREEITHAAELAGADEFIRGLPEGYDTLLSERGESLSGGQRQRISIARAMLRESPILILDEPQSGLDAEAAGAVEESWRALTEGRTTFVIAHELRLVSSVDRILVIEDGSVVEAGSHEELLASNGLYARLYALQERDPVQP